MKEKREAEYTMAMGSIKKHHKFGCKKKNAILEMLCKRLNDNKFIHITIETDTIHNILIISRWYKQIRYYEITYNGVVLKLPYSDTEKEITKLITKIDIDDRSTARMTIGKYRGDKIILVHFYSKDGKWLINSSDKF